MSSKQQATERQEEGGDAEREMFEPLAPKSKPPLSALVCKMCNKQCRNAQGYERHFRACAMALRPSKPEDYQPTYAELYLLVQGLQDEVFRLRQKMETVERRLVAKTVKVNILDWLQQNRVPTAPNTFREWMARLVWTVDQFVYLLEGHTVQETLLFVLRTQPETEDKMPVISFTQKNTVYVRDRPVKKQSQQQAQQTQGQDAKEQGTETNNEDAVAWREMHLDDMMWLCYYMQINLQGKGLLEWRAANADEYQKQGPVFLQFQKAIQKLADLPTTMTSTMHQLQHSVYQWAKTELQTTSLTLV